MRQSAAGKKKGKEKERLTDELVRFAVTRAVRDEPSRARALPVARSGLAIKVPHAFDAGATPQLLPPAEDAVRRFRDGERRLGPVGVRRVCQGERRGGVDERDGREVRPDPVHGRELGRGRRELLASHGVLAARARECSVRDKGDWGRAQALALAHVVKDVSDGDGRARSRALLRGGKLERDSTALDEVVRLCRAVVPRDDLDPREVVDAREGFPALGRRRRVAFELAEVARGDAAAVVGAGDGPRRPVDRDVDLGRVGVERVAHEVGRDRLERGDHDRRAQERRRASIESMDRSFGHGSIGSRVDVEEFKKKVNDEDSFPSATPRPSHDAPAVRLGRRARVPRGRIQDQPGLRRQV